MATLFNLSAIAVGASDETLQTSNSGFTLNSTAAAWGTVDLQATSSTTPHSAWAASAPTKGYLVAAGSRTQTVRLKIQRFSTVGVAMWQAVARASTGDDYIEALWRPDTWQAGIYKIVNGVRTAVLAYTAASPALSAGDYGVFELRVVETGSPGSPSADCSIWWNKNGGTLTQIGTTVTITDSVFDINGQCGFGVRSASGQSTSIGAHLLEAFAEDDTSSGFTLTADQGSYSLTGQAVGVLATRLATAEQGSYSLTGQNATLLKETPGAFVMPADYGQYEWIGEDALSDYAMNADFGTYSLSGQDAAFGRTYPQAYTITAVHGSYILTGRSTRLLWSNAPLVPSTGQKLAMAISLGFL